MAERVVELWQCPYCFEEYEDKDDALDCARACVDPDDVIETERVEYYCKYCKESRNTSEYADKCEEYHEDNKDMHFCNFEDNEAKERLKEASKHPEQVKLT